jgi:hypothetical protein
LSAVAFSLPGALVAFDDVVDERAHEVRRAPPTGYGRDSVSPLRLLRHLTPQPWAMGHLAHAVSCLSV